MVLALCMSCDLWVLITWKSQMVYFHCFLVVYRSHSLSEKKVNVVCLEAICNAY